MRVIIVVFICIYLSLPFLLGLLVWNIEIFHLNAIKHTKHTINLQEIETKKIRVGDIDIAYKIFGNGSPMLLINGYSAGSTLQSIL
ncbi:MAG: hypothetical protein E6L03_01780 [Thaumarchaeota archaeon]|nr:MAG: hypothetical protein E6L03_01780 [Nitrososphaerota archaeon]